MNIKAAAARLDGLSVTEAITSKFMLRLKDAGFIAVFAGVEDDTHTTWMIGAVGRNSARASYVAYPSAEYRFTPDGYFGNRCNDDHCPHIERMTAKAAVVRARHSYPDEASSLRWRFATDIPHETFELTHDGKPFCVGVIFAATDAVSPASVVSRTAEIIGEGDLVFPAAITPVTQAFLEKHFPDCDDPEIVRMIALAINTERSRCFLVAETEPEYPTEWTQEEVDAHAGMDPQEIARGAVRDTKQCIMDRIASGETPASRHNDEE